jgi:hypothetical protein
MNCLTPQRSLNAPQAVLYVHIIVSFVILVEAHGFAFGKVCKYNINAERNKRAVKAVEQISLSSKTA